MQLRVFTRLAERGSFSAVGRDFRVTQSSISKTITALEQALHVQLVSRSTRSVSLTEAGSRYYERCRQILADMDEADAAVSDATARATGTLKIAAPIPFGLMFVAPRMARFQSRYPALEIDLDLNDNALNLVAENIDVAIRLGDLRSPGLVMKKLGDSPFVAVASPSYLALRGIPKNPKDLVSHNCLTYTIQTQQTAWTFLRQATTQIINVSGNYRSNNLLALKDAAISGMGITQLPLWMVDSDMTSGALRLVLENYRLPAFGIQAVFPSARRIPARTKLFVDFMQDELSSVPYFRGVRASAKSG